MKTQKNKETHSSRTPPRRRRALRRVSLRGSVVAALRGVASLLRVAALLRRVAALLRRVATLLLRVAALLLAVAALRRRHDDDLWLVAAAAAEGPALEPERAGRAPAALGLAAEQGVEGVFRLGLLLRLLLGLLLRGLGGLEGLALFPGCCGGVG
jgi:hypothetical protein